MKSQVLRVLLLTIALLISSLTTSIEANTPNGFFPVGTNFEWNSRTVYFVNNAAEFRNIRNDTNGIYLIMNDIDMAGTSISNLTSFRGVIHGFGHSVSNMRFTGESLIADQNFGHVEWIDFANIVIDTPNSNDSTGILFGTNSGDIQNITYDVTNTSGTSVIPPLVNINSDFIDNVIGNYDITADVDEAFTFYSALSSTSSSASDFWVRGNLNVSTTSVFYYRSYGSNFTSNRCVDDLNVSVNTATSINASTGARCQYRSNDSLFTYAGESFDIDFPSSGTLSDDAAVVNLLSDRFDSDYWSINSSIALNEESRYNLAGEHNITVNFNGDSSTILPLYQAPRFDSDQLDFNLFSPSYNGSIQTFSTAVSYSTNYSRVFINDEPVGRSGTIERLENVNIRIESDYNLPTLEYDFNIYPELNFREGSIVDVGFLPTTSLGFLTKDDAFLFVDETIDKEGQYTIEVSYGDDSLSFNITVLPQVSGVTAGTYTDPVTPVITAASVQINGEDYEEPSTFSEVGHYDVVFPNLESQNFRFTIVADYEFKNSPTSPIHQIFEIKNNFSTLRVNGFTYDAQFVQSHSAIVVSTGSSVALDLGPGRHTIELSGVNNYRLSFNRNNAPDYSIVTDETTNGIAVNVTGADLFIDREIVSEGAVQLSELGVYELVIQFPEDIFSLSAGQQVYAEDLQIDPVFETLRNGRTYDGSVKPDIYAEGGVITLNEAAVTLGGINREFNVPGIYRLNFAGNNNYESSVMFTVRPTTNVNERIFYDSVDIRLSSPNNVIDYREPDDLHPAYTEAFNQETTLRKPGIYTISYFDNREEKIQLQVVEIRPMDRTITSRDSSLGVFINNLHPDVQLVINEEIYSPQDRRIEFTASGRYNLRFESRVDEVIYEEDSFVISPQFDPPIKEESNQVERYVITNDFEEFYINDRLIENEVFLENQTFNVNQNGENTIRIIGVNGEEFVYTSFFNNPHFNNVTRLSWYAIGTGFIAILAIVGRYVLAVRHDR